MTPEARALADAFLSECWAPVSHLGSVGRARKVPFHSVEERHLGVTGEHSQ